MKALLISPAFPPSYWGQQRALPLTGKQAVVPPLGLITVATLLPVTWSLRLVDMNVEPLGDDALAWADVVLLSAMRVQRDSFHDVIRRAHALGKRVVAGGPYVTTDPAAGADADHLVLGEAEEVLGPLAHQLENGLAPARVSALERRPDVTASPVPRFDLLKVERYTSIGVQFSRGCPFQCEFCDIIEIFGRRPRTKSPAQLVAELDAVYATGFRGAVFLVDDNFIGNAKAAKALLPELAAWNRAHRHPFDYFTEASVNLAADDELIDLLVAAGFSSVFLGIETPSAESLLETKKHQNLRQPLDAAVEKLVRRGLEVMAGFIVGFDADRDDVFERQWTFISRSPIAMAMVGLLFALPGTQLWRRLEREGRLHGHCDGDNVYRPNFRTVLPEERLVSGFRELLLRLYAPDAYFARCLRSLRLRAGLPRRPYRRPLGFALGCFARSLWRQGVLGRYRGAYWRFLLEALKVAPRRFDDAVTLAIVGEHMIRYTAEDVLPRLGEAANPTIAPALPEPTRRLEAFDRLGDQPQAP
jgi:radical SAM superfamily enzyme YgiQ (UPF0313 family)